MLHTHKTSVPEPSKAQIRESALKRLMRDYKEVRLADLDTIAAEPIENLFLWHCNILAPADSPYRGAVFHVVLKFPHDYPSSPPSVTLMNRVHHSHVFGGYICLDMLQPYHGQHSFGAWTSAYSVLSILRQLQVFFLDREHIDHYWDNFHPEEDIEASWDYQCKICDHHVNEDRVYPRQEHWSMAKVFGDRVDEEDIEEQMDSPRMFQDEQEEEKIRQLTSEIPLECLANTFSFLSAVDLEKTSAVCQQWNSASKMPLLKEAIECCCFHTKKDSEEALLGYGINLEFTKQGILQTVTSPLDIISLEAYSHGLRHSVWHQKFTYFFPLYINKSHAETKAIPYLEKAVTEIYSGIKVEGVSNNWLNLLIDLLCKLMSSMVVEIMKGELHASFVALEGYCAFHRWLIYLVDTYPNVLGAINGVVENFMSSEENRHKSVKPNLGEFLPLLSVSDYTWDDVKRAVVTETLDRNSLWISFKFPTTITDFLEGEEYVDRRKRMNKCFAVSRVSARLIMFHKFFLTKVARRHSTLEETAAEYDFRYGKPSEELKRTLQEEIFSIMDVRSYIDYFAYVEYPKKRANVFSVNTLLNRAMTNAIKRQYVVPTPVSGPQQQTEQKSSTSATVERPRGTFQRRGRGRGGGFQNRGGHHH